MRVLTVIQARLGSSRFPGKVLRPILGQPVLALMIERVRRARLAGTIVVAIPEGEKDRPLETLCTQLGVPVYSGSEEDLLERHYQVGRTFAADAVVKIPSDCPLIDPRIIDRVLAPFLAEPENWDYYSNLHPASWPDGNDVEIMAMPALKAAWQEAQRPLEREHTTPFLWENPDRFRVGNVIWELGLDFSMSHRWTLDYPEDLDFIRRVYEELYPTQPEFGLGDILDLLEREPDIAAINRHYAGVNWYRHHLDELKTIGAYQTRGLVGDFAGE